MKRASDVVEISSGAAEAGSGIYAGLARRSALDASFIAIEGIIIRRTSGNAIGFVEIITTHT